MNSVIKVKQIPDSYAISTGLDKYNKSRMPKCKDLYQVAQGFDGRYLTGIDEESFEMQHLKLKDPVLYETKVEEIKKLRTQLENLLRKDLSATSNYWETFFIEISTDEDLILNMSNPQHVLKHRALIANGLAAPDLEAAGQPKYINAKYYCFTEEKYQEDQVSTQKLKDKGRSTLFAMADNPDKMLLMGQFLEGFKYKKGMKPDTYYAMLSQYINESRDNVESFIRAANTSVEDLQYKVTVDRAIKNKKIKFKDGQFYRGGVNLGSTLPEVLATLKSPEFANEFVAIHEEVNI